MKRNTFFGFLLIGLSILGAGCAKSREAAATATQDFRRHAFAEDWASIYKGSAPEFQKSVSEADFVKMMNGVRGKLGGWKSSQDPTWNVNVGTGGRIVTLKYQSQFEKGTATEDFVWRIENERGILVGYHINSPVFMLN
jgi:hypothetical protein